MPTKKKSTTISNMETVETDTPTDLQNTPTDLQNTPTDLQNTPTDLQNTPTDTVAFDYSVVDDDTAQYLRKATARIANSYADIGAVLAEAQERLANNKNGVFEKWCTSLGMPKRTAYRFIQIHEYRNSMLISCQNGTISENALDLFDNLPKTLQADISSPSAPAEAVNAVLSGDIKSHKDYIAIKKRLDELQTDVENLTEENNRLICENSDLEEERNDLQAENKQLRERPVDTVIVTSSASDDLDRAFDNDPTPAPANNLRFDQLKDFFEDSYERAYNELRTLYHFAKDTYPGDIREYAETRITDLKDYIEKLDALYFDKDED